MKQSTASTEAQNMDTLLAFRKKGYNLKDTADPAVLSMELGNGYTLLASVKREWLISFDDGVQTSEYQIDSVKIPYTNSKDANKLWKEYEKALKDVKIEGEPQEAPVEVAPVETPIEVENVEPVQADDAADKAKAEREENLRKLAEYERQTAILLFQALLKKAIEVKEKALYPENPLFELPLDAKGEEITQKEQAVLKCVLTQFNKIFEVE